MVYKPEKNEVQAHAAALRALAAYLEFVSNVKDIEDEREYEEKLNMYVKGAGSTFLDEIDATGAYDRKASTTEDPNFLSYVNAIVSISFHGIQTLYSPDGLAALMAKLVNTEFCRLLQEEIDLRSEKNKG